MANPYFTVSGVPARQTRGTSANQRAEFSSIEGGFDSVYAEILALAAAVGIAVSVTEVDVASSATTDIGDDNGPVVRITGNNSITSFGANYMGAIFLRFADVLTLTHSSSLVLPGAANITTVAGDACIAVPIGDPANGWRILAYCRMSLTLLDDVAVRTSSTYANPAWLTSLAWSKITGAPTTIAGYGITDAPTKTGSGASGSWGIDITGVATTVSTTVESGAVGTTQALNDNSTKIATTAYADRVGTDRISNVDATVSANALTLTIGAQVLDFRSTTLTDGTPVTRSISSPITMTVSSGSTLGTTNAVQSDIAIIAIDNAGTVEVACVNISGGNDLSETGLISTTAEGGAGAADSASTWYSNTSRTNVAYRVAGVIRSTQATAGAWATSPSLVQGAGGNFLIIGTSMVRLNTNGATTSGFGSTNTAIRRFTTVVTNQGADITYADSATLGASFTINTNGVYAVMHCDSYATVAQNGGVSKNSASLTTNINAIAAAEVLCLGNNNPTNSTCFSSWTGYLNAGDVIRPHGTPSSNTGTVAAHFIITRVS